jgi:3-oxoacyl-[acyl-carrier-protein] synthase-3
MRNPGHIRAIGVAFPEQVRSNDWWEQHHGELVANAREAMLAKVWADHSDAASGPSTYDRCIGPYLTDPFRGTVERRWMSAGESALDLQVAAAEAALEAAGLEPADIDLLLVNALRPDHHVVADAAYLMRRLGGTAPAINFESACASALVGYQLASDLVRVGRHRRVLVVNCCTYTRDVDPADSFSWFLGDGATAFVVEAAASPTLGLLGAHTVPTFETCGIFSYELVGDAGDRPRLQIHANPRAGSTIREQSGHYLRTCVDGALHEAGVTLDDIDFLIVNTPTAWYAQFCTAVLGFGLDRTVDNYPRFANCGPALWANNLHTAIREQRVQPGALLLGYSIGSVSTATAAVFRLGEVGVGERTVSSTSSSC